MKFSILSLGLMAVSALAGPVPSDIILRRAGSSEISAARQKSQHNPDTSAAGNHPDASPARQKPQHNPDTSAAGNNPDASPARQKSQHNPDTSAAGNNPDTSPARKNLDTSANQNTPDSRDSRKNSDTPDTPEPYEPHLEEIATVGFATQGKGTTGGKGGKTVEVESLSELKAAVLGIEPKIVLIIAAINGNSDEVLIGSHKTVIGKDSHAVITNVQLRVKDATNVIIRNLAVKNVVGGDAINLFRASSVWLDHLDLSSDRNHGMDYYDGLADMIHGTDNVSVTNCFFHDHFKVSLIGHSENNDDEDKDFLRVTFYQNYFKNVHSRTPAVRDGTVHVVNNYYEGVTDAINTRDEAQLRVENNVFVDTRNSVQTINGRKGFAVVIGNDFGSSRHVEFSGGSFTTVPYKLKVLDASAVKAAVVDSVGAIIEF